MRGQLTFENLMLSLVAVALIIISVTALASIKHNAEDTFDLVAFKASAARLEAAANEVCAMGNGNRRVVYLEVPLTLEGSAEGARAIHESGTSVAFGSSCEVESSGNLDGKVAVKNENGKIIAE